jgi:hypothetical protein
LIDIKLCLELDRERFCRTHETLDIVREDRATAEKCAFETYYHYPRAFLVKRSAYGIIAGATTGRSARRSLRFKNEAIQGSLRSDTAKIPASTHDFSMKTLGF